VLRAADRAGHEELEGGGEQAVGVGAGEEAAESQPSYWTQTSRMPAAVSKRSTIASDGCAVCGAHLNTAGLDSAPAAP
jgi:hypothetical protein